MGIHIIIDLYTFVPCLGIYLRSWSCTPYATIPSIQHTEYKHTLHHNHRNHRTLLSILNTEN